MRRNSKQYYNIYYTALKTIVIILLLVMLLQCKFSTPFGSILDKFYFHLNLIENIDDFKGVVYSIHDNLYDKNPIIDLTL
jgi:hypothetical protein